MSELHDIGWAVKQLWDGKRVARAGWNGRGQYLALIRGHQATEYSQIHIEMKLRDDKISMAEVLPFVMMRTVQGTLVPWLCSQTDLLAVDWEIAEPGERPQRIEGR